MQRRVPSQELALFIEVVEAGSFTAAARVIGVPTSTVSRSIGRLEKSVRALLFDRRSRLLVLTPPGKALYAQTAPHVAALRSVVRGLQNSADEAEGLLRVTCPLDTGGYLGEMFLQFVQRYPKITLDVHASSAIVDLQKDGFDAALRATRKPMNNSTLVAKKLRDTSFGFFASPLYLAREGTPQTPEDLQRHAFVTLRSKDGKNRLRPRGPRGTVVEVHIEGRLSVNEFPLVVSLLRAGAGVGIVPTGLVEQEVAAGKLARVLPDWSLPAGTVYVVYPLQKHLPKKVAAFRDFVVDYHRTTRMA